MARRGGGSLGEVPGARFTQDAFSLHKALVLGWGTKGTTRHPRLAGCLSFYAVRGGAERKPARVAVQRVGTAQGMSSFASFVAG